MECDLLDFIKSCTTEGAGFTVIHIHTTAMAGHETLPFAFWPREFFTATHTLPL